MSEHASHHTSRHGNGGPERRSHHRFPLIKDLAEPVDLILMDAPPAEKGAAPPKGGPSRDLPAVLTNLSAGGMSLLVFAHVSGDTRLKMVLNLPGLEGLELQGHVKWTSPKGDTTAIGVQFNHLSHEIVKRINHMAEAFQDCELKIAFGIKDVCFRACAYWPLCHKPVKLKH